MSAATATAERRSLFFRALGGTQRARMLDAIVWAVAEKGYPNVTVADVSSFSGGSSPTATTLAPPSASSCTLGAASWHTGQVTLKKTSTAGPSDQGSATPSSENEGARSPDPNTRPSL